jgi:hypothetical protein
VGREMASGQKDGEWTERWRVDREMASGEAHCDYYIVQFVARCALLEQLVRHVPASGV